MMTCSKPNTPSFSRGLAKPSWQEPPCPWQWHGIFGPCSYFPPSTHRRTPDHSFSAKGNGSVDQFKLTWVLVGSHGHSFAPPNPLPNQSFNLPAKKSSGFARGIASKQLRELFEYEKGQLQDKGCVSLAGRPRWCKLVIPILYWP